MSNYFSYNYEKLLFSQLVIRKTLLRESFSSFPFRAAAIIHYV